MAENQDDAPIGWNWGSRAYENHAGDREWLMREALRRAIDIRDQGVTTRAVMLVNVLQSLQSALGIESVDAISFWSEFE
jgi:hypothetical protein